MKEFVTKPTFWSGFKKGLGFGKPKVKVEPKVLTSEEKGELLAKRILAFGNWMNRSIAWTFKALANLLMRASDAQTAKAKKDAEEQAKNKDVKVEQ